MPALIAQYGLLIVVAIIFCGELGIPTFIPGEIALLIAGSQAVHSVPALIFAALVFGTVDVIATSTIHTASRTGGNRALCCVLRRLHSSGHDAIVEKWRARLGGRDSLVVFVTRLIPMFRLYASITTGLIRIRLRDFFRGAIPAAYLWAATPLTLGYLLRSRIQGLESQYGLMMHLVILGSILATAGGACLWWVRRGKSSTAGLCRVRIILALTVAFAVCARVTLALLGSGVGYSQLVLPALSRLTIWGTVISLLTIGLLWIASHDLHSIRHYPEVGRRMSSVHAATWIGLIVMVVAFTVSVGVHSPAT